MRRKGALFDAALILFVLFAPFAAAAFDIKAVVSAFFALTLLCAFFSRVKAVSLTKMTLLAFLCAVYAFLCVIWSSDKGGECFLALCATNVFFFACAVRGEKERLDKRTFSDLAKTSLRSSAVIYALLSILYQFFIADSIFGYRADFGSGLGCMAALLATAGILGEIELYRGKKKPLGFFAVTALLMYTLLLSRSTLGYAAAFFTFGARMMKNKKRRTEGAAAFFGAFVCLAVKIIYSLVVPMENGEYIKAAFYGLFKIFGTGYGGYGAANALLPGGYASSPPLFALLLESWGVFGLAVVVLAFFYAATAYRRSKSEYDALALAAYFAALFSPCVSATVVLPLVAARFAAAGYAAEIKLNGIVRTLCAAAGCVLVYFSVSRIPFAMGENARETGEFEKAAGYYETCAKMEVFFRESWENAFDCAFSAYQEGADNASVCEEYIKNAARFGKGDLGCEKKLASLYTLENKHDAAKEIWDDIAKKCDNEYIYPEYAEKIYNCMALHVGDAAKEKELYENLSALAENSEDADVKKSVNDVLSRAQKYYVSTIEGEAALGDMFLESEPSEGESETESGNTEG